MRALELFKTAGVWDEIKGYLDNDYVKYPAIGAATGGAGMGLASAIGGPGEGVEEKPGEKSKRIFGSALKGMGFGGAAGLGVAGLKDWSNSSGSESPETGNQHTKLDGPRKSYESPTLDVLKTLGMPIGAITGYAMAGRDIANTDKGIDYFNAKGTSIVDEIKEQMAGGKNQETIDALKKTFQSTGDPDIQDQINKLKGSNKPQTLDDLLGRLSPTSPEHAPIAVGAGAKAMSHATGQGFDGPMGKQELDAGLHKMIGEGDVTHNDSIMKKLFAKVAPGSSGMENLGKQTANYASNGFTPKPHLDTMSRFGRRSAGVGLGALGGYYLPSMISAPLTGLFGRKTDYKAPESSKAPTID